MRQIDHAIAAHKAGNIKEAEALYRDVLKHDGRDFDALHMLGVICAQREQYDEAERLLRTALSVDQRVPPCFYNYANVLSKLKRYAEAIRNYDKALALAPNYAPIYSDRGNAQKELGQLDEALKNYDRALTLNPNFAEAYYNRGIALEKLKRPTEALASYDRALTLKPNYAAAYSNRGDALLNLKRFAEALASCDRAIAFEPGLATAHSNRAAAQLGLNRFPEALTSSERAITLQPDLALAHSNRGAALLGAKRFSEALASCDQAISLEPGVATAHATRGVVLLGLKRFPEALASCDRALSLDPGLATAHSTRAAVLLALKRFAEALASCDQAIALDPGLAAAHSNRAAALLGLKRLPEALASCDQAIAVDPRDASAHSNRAAVLLALKRFPEALASCDQAIALDPGLAITHTNRGGIQIGLKRYTEAVASCERAISLDPGLASAHSNRGAALMNLGQYADAFAACDKAFAIEPDLSYAEGNRLHAKQQVCGWDNLGAEMAHLLSALRNRQLVTDPFFVMAMPSQPADQLNAAQLHIAENWPTFSPPAPLGKNQSHDRIRVAYLSSDLRNHAVAYLTVGLFEHHDRSRFEIAAISFGTEQDSVFQQRIKASFEHFIDCRSQSDQDIADLIRQRDIDIVVDLNGLTRDARPGILARRPAPLALNYLGYSGTMGADYFDYIIADPTVIPAEHFEFYREKVVWLPESFMVNDAARIIAARTPSREELHLPEAGFVFCCFNQTYKFNPAIFDVWMRLLRHVDGSVLWLRESSTAARHNLRLEAERRRIAPDRLVFAPPVRLVGDHLARHRQADLFLDTLPYNAHATTSDALWAGVPVITCLGSTFAGRVAASLLKAAGLPDLITTSLDEYEALALKLARDPLLLASVKKRLADNRYSCPLFDTGRFARHIESAYVRMWQRFQNGEPPASFAVEELAQPSNG